jgi:hypothetical protein
MNAPAEQDALRTRLEREFLAHADAEIKEALSQGNLAVADVAAVLASPTIEMIDQGDGNVAIHCFPAFGHLLAAVLSRALASYMHDADDDHDLPALQEMVRRTGRGQGPTELHSLAQALVYARLSPYVGRTGH